MSYAFCSYNEVLLFVFVFLIIEMKHMTIIFCEFHDRDNEMASECCEVTFYLRWLDIQQSPRNIL